MWKCLFTLCLIMTGFFGWAKKHKTLEVWVGASSCSPTNTGIVGDLEERAGFVSPVPLSRTPSSPSALWFTPCCWWRVLHVIANSLLMVSARIHSTKGRKSKVIIGKTLNKIHWQSLNTLIKGLQCPRLKQLKQKKNFQTLPMQKIRSSLVRVQN